MKFPNREQYRSWILQETWYQTIELGGGLKTNGSVETGARLAEFRKVDFRGKRVLDIGCNSGGYALFAKRSGAREVIGIDLDEHRISQARTLAANEDLDVRFEVMAMDQAPALGTFDIVLCIAVLSEVSDLPGSVETLRQVVGSTAYLEMPLARPILYASISRSWVTRSLFRQLGRVCEVRQTKRGNWCFSPTVSLLQEMLGPDFRVERRGRGVRYDRVEIHRR